MEPDKQYYWATAPVSFRGAKITANILHGKSPTKGSVPLETPDWDGRDDPLFTTALAVVEETLRANEQFAWDLKPLFRLEMAYLLLWSSIERYTSLRYHLGKDATAKVLNIAEEPAFVAALKEVVREKRTLYRADEPQHSVTLRADQPKKSLAYYYQIRNNAIHRGKAVGRDFDILREALDQLLRIFTCVLQAAFHECQAGENHT